MPGSPDQPTRERLLAAAVELLEVKGPAASGTQEILKLAQAPRGSFYFHFPDGKDQLVAEAVAQAAATTAAAITGALQDRAVPLPDRIEAFIRSIGTGLVADDYRLGCAVGATTLEASATVPSLRAATEDAFASWAALLVAEFTVSGIAEDRAVALADAVVAGMEGATMLARARRDTAPIDHVAAALRASVEASL